jgi:dolichol-phosphate mannosyltransferase
LRQPCADLQCAYDGSADNTWELLTALQGRLPELAPIKKTGLHGFGRAVVCGLDHMKGDATVVMMADESDVWLEKYFSCGDYKKRDG